MNCPAADLTKSLPIALAFACLALFYCPPAQAFGEEGQIWGGVGAANINHAAPTAFGWWGPRADLGIQMPVTDFWRLSADLSASHHFPRRDDEADEADELLGPHTVLSAALGARYALDVFTYIPFVGLSAVFHPLNPPSSAPSPGNRFSLRATLGVDYRHSRRLSYGAALEVSAPVTAAGDFPHYSGIRFHVGYHFRRF